MSTIIYIIPGFGERASSKSYRKFAAGFQNQKIKSVMISIQWRYKSMTDYLNQFMEQVKDSTSEVYLLGFSFGAMIAAIAATLLKPSKLFLCSLSPFFKEDLPALTAAGRRSLGIKRLRDFSNYSFEATAKKITCKTFLFIGELELSSVINRSATAHRKIQNSKFKIVKGANHNVGHPNYQREILKTIRTNS